MSDLPDPLNLVGSTIAEKYAIESVVGEGGFAIVYRATHLIWKRPVAIKVFKSLRDVAEAQREKLLQEFIQEGALLAELSERSAAICQARDVGTLTLDPTKKDWLPYMVLEWLEGSTLETILAQQKERSQPPWSLEHTLRILQPAAEALALAHRKRIAHRDVKPANIFMCGDPEEQGCPVKLLDFGIAKVVQDAQKAGGAFTKTAGQVTSFTPSYGAPEQFSRSHGSTGPWTDVFAFALVLTECLTHKEPLEGDDYMQIAYASSDKTRRPTPRAKGAVIDDAIEAIFAKALAVDPAERFRSLGEFWEELRSKLPSDSVRAIPIADQTGPVSARRTDPVPLSLSQTVAAPSQAPSQAGAQAGGVAPGFSNTTPGTATTSPSPPRSRRTGFILGGVAAVIGLGVLGAWLRNAGPKSDPSAAVLASIPPTAKAVPSAKGPCPDGMIAIEGGRFFMGSEDPKDPQNQQPAHNVTLTPYCIDRTEVTVARYKACSDLGHCKRAGTENWWKGMTPHDQEVYDPLCNIRDPAGRAKHPINCVDWDMARTYCAEEGARLPTEAEWEFAARGPDGRKYPWGDEPPTEKRMNGCGVECSVWGKEHGVEIPGMYAGDDGYPATAPVGSFPEGKSRYGLVDVVGNVFEWVGDYMGPYATGAQINPKGPPAGSTRVVRGGAWNASDVAWVRPSFRHHEDPKKRSHGIGFRCAKSI